MKNHKKYFVLNKSTTLNGVNVLESSHKKNVLLGVTCRSRLNNNSHILLVRHISIDSLLNKDKDNNNNQNSSSNASSAAVGDNSNNLNNNSNSNNTLSQESNNNLPSQQVSENEDRNVNETDRSENEMDQDRPDDGDEMDVDPSDDGEQSDKDVESGKLWDLLELPAKDLSEDRLRDHLHTLREDLYNPSKEMLSFLEDNADVCQEYIERLQELEDELQRRKDVGIIPDSEPSDSDSESSSSDSGDVQEDLNTSNTQSGGSADNGVDTSTSSATTNNQSSTGSDSFSWVSNENSPDSFDNLVESGYLLDSLDSSILEFVILFLPFIIIVLLLLPLSFVFLLKRSKFL